MSKMLFFNVQLDFMVQTAIALCASFALPPPNKRKLLNAPKEPVKK